MDKINKETLSQAVTKGIISGEQYNKILALDSAAEPATGEKKRGLNYVTAFYYFGALIIIFAFTYFLVSQWDKLSTGLILAIALAFQATCFGLGIYLRKSLNYKVSGSLLVTAAVAITPLTVYSLEKIFGIWPVTKVTSDAGSYEQYWTLIKPCWVYIEFITLLVAAATLFWVRFSFLAVVIGHTAWFLSMDLAELMAGGQSFSDASWEIRKWVSIIIGAIMISVGRLLNRKTEEDYSLWLFIYGALIVTTATAFIWLNNELNALLYLALHIIFVVMSIRWQRTSLMVFGAIGIYVYLGRLAWNIFRDSPFFPIILALIGLLMILGTVSFQRNKEKLIGIINKPGPA
ncbi:MAG: DUF2157 domain-containing protein [Candidatus Omnitrophota bacterium]